METHFKDEVLLRRQEVIDCISAALNVCSALSLGVVQEHRRCCPYARAADLGEQGLRRLLERFTEETP